MHALNLPCPQFCRVFSPQTSHKCPYSYPLHICDSNHTHPLTSWQQSLSCQLLAQTEKKCFTARNGVGERTIFSASLCIGGQKRPHPVPTKVFPKLNPETAMLLAPLRCTHPPPPVPLFLLTQNLSPKTLCQVTSQDESFMPSTDGYTWESVKGCTM